MPQAHIPEKLDPIAALYGESQLIPKGSSSGCDIPHPRGSRHHERSIAPVAAVALAKNETFAVITGPRASVVIA